MEHGGGAGTRRPGYGRVASGPVRRVGAPTTTGTGSRPGSGPALARVEEGEALPVVLLAGRLVWADDVRFYREALGWTRADLEKASGVPSQTIGRLERGDTVRESSERSIADALGPKWADLFDRALLAPRARPVPARSRYFRQHPPPGATVLQPRADRRRAG